MHRKRNRNAEQLPISSSETEDFQDTSTSTQPKSEWALGACTAGMCAAAGVACKDGPVGAGGGGPPTHKCICVSDHSTPASGENPCRRRVVPTIPRPILNIIPPSATNSSAFNRTQGTSSLREATAAVAPGIAVTHPPLSRGAVIFVLAGVCLSALLVVAFCWWKRKLIANCAVKGKHRKHDNEISPLSVSKGLLGNYIANPQYQSGSPTLSPVGTMPVPVLPRDRLVFVQEIGEGCFGKVFKGQLHSESVETVAVKVLKDGASKQAEEDFMREVEIMSTFRHENILTLLGIVLKEPGGRPWMVFEFMKHGDLAEVLRSNSKPLWKPVPGLDPLTKEDMLWIAVQIAGGMKYLAAQRFVHNDLACRNCLVGSGLTVKIADFGMSRDVYTCDYYRIGGSRPVPLRWMSPETVMYRRFTLESDVWSFGVVLWEIYSFGMQPYFGATNEEVVKHILQGILLVPPQGCPSFICDLMRACWKTEPRDRIRFPEIYEKLHKTWEASGLSESLNLPRPPVLPVTPVAHLAHVASGDGDPQPLMDSNSYLLPKPGPMPQYLQPVSD